MLNPCLSFGFFLALSTSEIRSGEPGCCSNRDTAECPDEHDPRVVHPGSPSLRRLAGDTLDTDYAAHRQRFLAEQGYAYRIVDADDLLGPAVPDSAE